MDIPRNRSNNLPASRKPRRDERAGTIVSIHGKTVVSAIKGVKTPVDWAQLCNEHPNQIKQWCDQLLDGATVVCSARTIAMLESSIVVEAPYMKIEELKLDNEFLSEG